MADPRDRESTASHKAVLRQPRPTGLDGEASYPMFEVGLNADHVSTVSTEIVPFAAFDSDRNIVTTCEAGHLGKQPDQPIDGPLTNLVIGRFEVNEVGNYTALARS